MEPRRGTPITKRLYATPSVWLAALAGLLYSSWPLGLVLNPAVGRHALASQLEAPHQPYDWLFVLLDVLTGVFLVGVGVLQLRTRKQSFMLFAAVTCNVLFGLFVLGAALVPLPCDPERQVCGPILRNPDIVAHGAFSIVSVLSLLAGLVLLAIAFQRAQVGRRIRALLASLTLGWLGFGVGSLTELMLRIRGNNVLQDFFISLCGISVAVLVGGVEYLTRQYARAPLVTADANNR